MDLLDQFISHYRPLPWDPGLIDCCMCLADYAIYLGYQDPASRLRGLYCDEPGFERLINRSQGVVSLVSECAAFINAIPVETPSRGVIGVIGSPTNIQRQYAVIFDGKDWLVKVHRDMHVMKGRHLGIWRI